MDELRQQIEETHRLALVTQRIGFTLWQIQELEGVTAQYLVLLLQANKGRRFVNGDALDENVHEKTLGATIHHIAKAGLLSSKLESRFTNLLLKRNWLVHRSRADSKSAIHSDLEMQRLMVQLDEIAEESLSLIREIGDLSGAYVRKHGVSEKCINKKVKGLLDQWHASDVV